MNNKTIQFYKNKLALLILASVFISAPIKANAQWAVTDNTTHQLLGQQHNKLGQISTNQSVQIVQQDQLNHLQDQRARIAKGQADIARRDFENMPTLQQCAEITQSRSRAAASGGGGGSSSPSARMGGTGTTGTRLLNRPAEINDTATALAPVLANRGTLGTCTAFDVQTRIGGCSGVGQLSGADRTLAGITRNIQNGTQDAGGNRQQVNKSLTPEGYRAGLQNINNAAFAHAPALPTAQQVQRNPTYMALYKSVMIKLNAAHGAMKDVLNMMAQVATAPNKWLTEVVPKWNTLFPGESAPALPSRMDILRFETFLHFAKEDDLYKENDAVSIAKRTNNLLALNNVLKYENLRTQHNNSILLSHILVQLTTPVDIKQVRSVGDQTATR